MFGGCAILLDFCIFFAYNLIGKTKNCKKEEIL
jgi:hypothetical protein